jgi:hypothetical protein
MVNYMHVRFSGDLVEITGERDNLAISCDLITHANEYAYEHVQTK